MGMLLDKLVAIVAREEAEAQAKLERARATRAALGLPLEPVDEMDQQMGEFIAMLNRPREASQ